MEEKKETPPTLIELLQTYFETRIKLAKYQAIEGGTSVMANLLTDVAIIIGVLMTFIFATLTLAFLLGELLNGTWKGFGIIALVYLAIVLVLKYNRKNIERPIVNALIQKILKNQQ